MKRAPLLGLFAACIVCATSVIAQADESIPNLKGLARTFFDEGMTSAKAGNWKLAIYSFKEADSENPNALQIWFNLAIAESKVPGYELRADALLKAYLLRQPHSPQRDTITKLKLRLESTVRERIRLILSGMIDPSVNMVELCDNPLFHIAKAELRAGLYQEAQATLQLNAAKATCTTPGPDMAALVTASAVGGNIAITEQYADRLDAWLAARPTRGDQTELILNHEEGSALLPLYAAHNPNPDILSKKEGKPYQDVMALYDYIKANNTYGAPIGTAKSEVEWWPISSGSGARLSACWADRQGWGAATVREYLLRARSNILGVPNFTPDERDEELVRFAVAFYLLKQQDAAIGTLNGVADWSLQQKWLHNLSTPGSALPAADISEIFRSDYLAANAPFLRTEIATEMCLDPRLAIFELHRIGRDGFVFSNCYLGPNDGTRKRPGQESEILECVDALKTNPYGNAAADYSILDGIINFADTLSGGLDLAR